MRAPTDVDDDVYTRMAETMCLEPGDDTPTPLETVVPWDPDGGDDDRRRFEGEHLLHLDSAEWDLIDDLHEWRVPLRGVGSRCVHTPHRIPDGLVGGCEIRPAVPAMGGTFIIFPGE